MNDAPVAATTSAARCGLPVATGRETVRQLWRACRDHRARLAAIVTVGIASTAISVVPPLAIGALVDKVQAGTADLGTILGFFAIMVGAAVAGAGGAAVTTVLATRMYQTILAGLREQLVSRALMLPQHLVERAGTGDLISRTSDDVTAVADAAPAVIGVFTVTGFTIIVSLAGLAALQWPYAVVFMVMLPVYAVAIRWYLRTGPGIYRAERAALSARAQEIIESQRGYATVLGFGLGEQRHRTVMRASWTVAIQSVRARTVQSMFSARLNLAECLSLATVLVIGFLLIDHGASTVGAATAAMLLVLRLLGPINQLLFVTDTIQSAAASLSRIIGVTTIPVPHGALSHDDSSTTARSSVQLRNVSFHYANGPRVLDDITLDIPTGQHLAIVGASGAGKTTLAAVIAGIHPPDAGTLTRPGQTVLITQEVHTFAGTLRDNFTLTAPGATDRDIHAAVEAGGATTLLDLLLDGLDTLVGAGEHQLTDAQAQQLALVRLLLTFPELTILDEATAEAGSTYARLLDRTAEAALRGRTAVVIAHRLSQAAACDRIVVMDHGRIIETGTHDKLVAADGMYARLWVAWRKGQPVNAANRPE